MRLKVDLGPARRGEELGRDGAVLRAGVLDLAHPLNLGRDRTGACCAGWWASYDAGAGPAWEDDGHHALVVGLPGVVVQPADADGHFKVAVDTPRDPETVWPGAYPRRPQEEHGRDADLGRGGRGPGEPGAAAGATDAGGAGADRDRAPSRGGASLPPVHGEPAGGRRADHRSPAIPCRYCRTGSALRYEQTRALTGKAETAELHDPGCTTAKELDDGKDETIALYCQGCGQERTGNRWRWVFAPSRTLRCPRCARATEHHRAPPEVVEAEECLCGACRTRRKFDEDAAAAGLRRAA